MKIQYYFPALLILVLVSQSCDLLLGKEEAFECDKNAPIKVNEVDKCAFAVGTDYVLNEHDQTEQIILKFSYAGGNFQIGLYTNDFNIGKEYLNPGEVDFSFPELNKGGSGKFIITEFDRNGRKISGTFDITAEGAANYTAYPFHVAGSFLSVAF